MSNIETEKLINNTRYFFLIFFLIAAASSYISKSGFTTWAGILFTCSIYLTIAIINQVYINKKLLSKKLIYISVTIEILLVFLLKFFMSFNPKVGFGLAIKEPATYLVYFLFLILIALRYDKKLNIYAGFLAISSYVFLLFLALTIGEMKPTRDVAKFFQIDTIRFASEGPKVFFLVLFIFFITKMARFTNENVEKLENAEKIAYKNFIESSKILKTVEATSSDLINGSGELKDSSNKIDTILNEFGVLLREINEIVQNFSTGIENIREKSNFQYETVENNFSKIKEISNLMERIFNDSSSQSEKALEALKLADRNEKNINETILVINDMKDNSRKIEEISKTINDIADKTNLLSLNAAIESARAGEQGKGFAVVADEISKLASLSIDSSTEISSIIQDTVNNIENVSSVIDNLAEYINRIISFVKENSTFMDLLKKNTKKEFDESKILYTSSVEVDNAAKNVIDLSSEQAKHVHKILAWMNNMKKMGSEVNHSLKDIQGLSTRLEERSEELKVIIQNK